MPHAIDSNTVSDMCGIGGIVRFDGRPIDEQALEAMHARLRHRGPDGTGRFRDRTELASGRSIEAALVHARLSIIDIEGGAQPMRSSDDDHDPHLAVVVFNGCIYNHRDLRRQLERAGHLFRSDHSDTEVIVRGYQEWGGEELARRLDGMFAFAIWDRRTRSLVLARDRAGEKPLYLWLEQKEDTRTIVFGSTVAAVVAGARRAGHIVEIENRLPWHLAYFSNGYCSPNTLPFRSMHALAPGHVLVADEMALEKITPVQYWSPPTERSADELPDFESLLRDSVHDRLEADVPLGCFLSGGVDSSLVAKFATEARPDLRTFCVRMPDARYDESDYAERAAAVIGSTHETLDAEISPADDLTHLLSELALPFGDSSILPTYWVSRAARAHVKVALSGDGGDELFLGYERYQAADWLNRFGWALSMIPDWPLNRFHPKSTFHKLSRLGVAARGAGYRDLTTFFATRDLPRVDQRCQSAAGVGSGGIENAVREDFVSYLPDDLLRKVDTASMSVALEVRAPFLAQTVMNAALSTPVNQLLADGQRKGLLRSIARRHFPRELIDRRKTGFAVPIDEWFRRDDGKLGTMLRDHLNSQRPFGDLPLDLRYIRKLADLHLRGRANHGHRLFLLLTLSVWATDIAPQL